MRETVNINEGWKFIARDIAVGEAATAEGVDVSLPHTWNGKDGQDGGNDYVRAAYWYVRSLARPALEENGRAYLQFKGVNASAEVYVNGKKLAVHHGGYSKFRVDITDVLEEENVVAVRADNRVTDTVYPQTADFTFYGGIYRDVDLLTVSADRFDLDYYGAPGIKLTPTVEEGVGKLVCEAFVCGEGEVRITVTDGEGKTVATDVGGHVTLTVPDPHLWNGVEDPYLYRATATLVAHGKATDEIYADFGFRTFRIDPDRGFILNGKEVPLRGVCRHQDRPNIGNAITPAMHEEDVALIREVGANTVRLAHYQHDDYFYDLCDRAGLVVWAEIPYISKHMDNADDNAVSQMKELIAQQYNHPSIVCWGISNEITMHRAGSDRLDCHKKLQSLCHEWDATRPTVLACYMIKTVRNKLNYVTDLVSYNLYHGWYVPFFTLTGKKLDRFHRVHPHTPLGLSEYGAEAMPGLHAEKPKRGDNTEEFQCIFHERYLAMIEARPYLWATHVWNMFDFAADARDQGGEPGMNHKGLITFDRKTKKDAFYLYKAHWSKEPFLHLCGKRFVNRSGKTATVRVYTNAGGAELFVNGKSVGKQTGKECVFTFPLEETNELEAKCGELSDRSVIRRVAKPDPAYRLKKKGSNKSWEKQ